MKPSAVGALCANHPGTGAVEICSRCGAFLCGECAFYVREVVPVCATCRPLAENDGPPSRAAWASPPLVALGLGLLIAGFFVRGRDGLALWGSSLGPGLAGLLLAGRELRRIARLQAPRRGRWVAVLALVVGGLYSTLGLALLVTFAMFLRRLVSNEY